MTAHPLLFPVAWIALLALASGCVAQGTFNEVIRERDQLAVRNAKLERELETANEAVATMGETLSEKRDDMAEVQAAYDDLAAELEAEMALGAIRVLLMESGVTVMLPEDILFGSGSATLSVTGPARRPGLWGERSSTRLKAAHSQRVGSALRLPFHSAKPSSNTALGLPMPASLARGTPANSGVSEATTGAWICSASVARASSSARSALVLAKAKSTTARERADSPLP